MMTELHQLLHKIQEKAVLSYEGLPDIDLYMDQVIAYLSRQSVSGRDSENLTAAMVNNYIKDGLLPRAVEKKYNRDHLAFLIMISRLKQVLSVRDTALLLQKETENRAVCDYFDLFQSLLYETAAEIADTPAQNDESPADVAIRLALCGYIYQLACETVLENLKENLPTETEAKKAKPADKQKKSENS